MKSYLIYITMISVQLYMNQEPYIYKDFNSHYLILFILNGILLDNIHWKFTTLHVSDIYFLV